MAKTKTVKLGAKASSKALDVILGTEQRPYIIKDASIKDGFCNYTFEITSGTGVGDTHAVKGYWQSVEIY